MVRMLSVAAILTGVCVLAAGAAQARSSVRPPQIVDATVITQVEPDGYRVTALEVRFDRPVFPAHPSTFAVRATLTRPTGQTVTGVRTITSVRGHGRTLVLSLDPSEPLALGAYSEGGFTRLYDLAGAYRVTQAGAGSAVNSKVYNRIVDEYGSGSFTSAAGVTLPYRHFTPGVRRGQKYPLVVTLHGYGESGTGNVSQIAGNQLSVAFAKPGNAFVLSPQADPGSATGGAWWDARVQAAVVELVRDFLATHPAVDTDRVYLTGLSMGSYGSWAILPAAKGLFAGAVLVCGAGDEAAAVASLGDFPIWAVHSADDSVVAYDGPGSDYRIFQALEAAGEPVTWSEWSGLLSDAEQEALAAKARRQAARTGSKHLFTTLPAGTTPLFAHASWIPAYTHAVILDWLLAQHR
ncbi:PHB depolymerase family esterase [Paractinoplanes lichenicola]|uniref:Phospholipase n=1 Tax=Paractinoplanes lichenicola TaxID=2802976 RepID=A0ABS1VEI3_9ACTN|nr:PHB depolymerase family esterase [Actinoplanes lichenicola]MBL7253083.1 hypothetical protein [Actinoplanes lichenicola]